jgi:ABC-type microcin C transport system permease subunit YejE
VQADRGARRLDAVCADSVQLRHVNYDLTEPAPSPPSASNWLGTDDQARDVLARVIFGTRVSILFA